MIGTCRFTLAFIVLAVTFGACTEEDPEATALAEPDAQAPDMVPDATPEMAPDAAPDMAPDMMPDPDPEMQACEPLETDYAPGADDTWPVCISDDDTYHQFEMTISSIGRVAGFEEIADILWRVEGTPSADAFLRARDIYATDEGLDSRVQRREDEHYSPVADMGGESLRCRDEGVPELDPDRCVGPARILPILNASFQAGILGEGNGLVHSARLEAALLWFLYVSSHKEASTCRDKKKDCDSAYAYYTGGVPREDGLGLAGYFKAMDENVHDRVWDGILAVRCWRDLDTEEVAQDLDTQAQAIDQLDEALMNGLSRLVLDRLLRLEGGGDEAEAAWAFVQILGGVLLRETAERDPARASALEGELSKVAVDDVDAELVSQTLQDIFPCP